MLTIVCIGGIPMVLYLFLGSLGLWLFGHIALCVAAGAYRRIIEDPAISLLAKCREIAEYSLGLRTLAAAAVFAFGRN